MRSPDLPDHIFVSHASGDTQLATELCREMQGVVPFWLDQDGLVPGTNDWERELRDALSRSFAVMLITTPRTREAAYVHAELEIATDLGLPIIPTWAEGESWADCAPLRVMRTQYVDIRLTGPLSGREQLSEMLQRVVRERKPRHRLLSAERIFEHSGYSWVDKTVSWFKEGFALFVSIQLGFESRRSASVAEDLVAVFDPDAYDCVQALIDDLYLNYLQNRFPPFTYGSEWVLIAVAPRASLVHPQRVLAPWSWVSASGPAPVLQLEPYFGRVPLTREGLEGGTIWRVAACDASERGRVHATAYGLAINDGQLLDEVMNGPGKQPMPTVIAGFLELVPFERIEACYEHRLVVLDVWSHFAGRVLRETEKPFDRNMLARRYEY